jgi:cytochrome c oxidase assembly protein subunit 11
MKLPTPSRHRRLALVLVAGVAAMIGLTYASVPFYRIFCQVTGFGGYTQRADHAPSAALERMVTVRFNADVNVGLPWLFAPLQREVRVHVGETGMAYFRAQNMAGRRVTGQATFNVTPDKAGLYFTKIACFCFNEQTLEPGQSVDMPVTFFVDPKLASDPKMADVQTITLSYTFFRAVDDGAQTSQLAKPAAPAN